MPSFTHYVWNNEKIGFPPAKRTIQLAYHEPEKIVMTFAADLSEAGESYLDPAKAIRINGKIVQIPDFPENPMKLRIIEKENVDVTKYVQSSPPGVNNEVEVNYIVKGMSRAFLKRHVGTLSLHFVVSLPEVKEKEVVREVVKTVSGPTKFCMNCQYSMPADANFCPKCGVSPESFSGPETKSCVNCKETVPARAKYCPKCGAMQPL